MDDVNKSVALATTEVQVPSSINQVNLLDPKQEVIVKSFIERLMKSDKSGVKSVADGIAILARAQDLQLPFSSCIEHIHVISGKTGLDIHIIKALLSKAGTIVWNKTKDYVPLYQYTDGSSIYNDGQLPEWVVRCRNAKEAEEKSKDGLIGVYPLEWYADLKGNKYNQFQINDKCVKCINLIQAQAIAKEGKFPIIRVPAVPIDFISEYEFTRYKKINGEKVVQKAIGRYSVSDAANAGLLDKDNYNKYRRIMIDTRAFTLGAREIADDIIMGCLELNELEIINGKEPTIYEATEVETISLDD